MSLLSWVKPESRVSPTCGSLRQDSPHSGLGNDVLHSVRAEKFPQRVQLIPVDKQHGLTEVPNAFVFHEAREMVGLSVGRDRVAEDEPTDTGALQRVSRVHVPGDDES